MNVTERKLRTIIREVLLLEDAGNTGASSDSPQAYVGPYVVDGTQADSGSGDQSEEECDQLGQELSSLHKQLSQSGADVQSLQQQIALTTKSQAKACGA